VWLSSGWGYFGSIRFASTWQHLAPQTTTRADGSFTLGQLPTDSDLSLQVQAKGFAADGAWPVWTGKFGGYAIRRGATTTAMGSGGEPNTPLMITLPRAAAASKSDEPILPRGAAAGPKTQWTAAQGGNGHSYQAVRMPKPLVWEEANRLAREMGGHLVTITSKAENDFVFRLVDDDAYWYHGYNWRGPWIGAVQPPGIKEPSAGWTWVTGEPFTYTNWDTGQPNHFNGAPENRVYLGNQRARIPAWCDVVEDFSEVVSFVVEWEPAQQSTGTEWPVSQGGNGHFYQVVCVTQGLTWDEANAAAQAQGGYLATITSAEENAFVFALIQDPACWNGPRGPWIGGFQTPGRPVREDWHWVTGEPFEYNHWSPGQPNDGGGADETRLEYGWGATTIADTWNDQPDWFRGVYAYIVEREPGGPTQAAAKLNAWVSLQVLEERVVVLDTLKPFSDYWPKKRHQVVGALSEKETLDYLRRRLQDKESLPIRIHVYFPPETRSAAEDLRQQIFALAREANAERDIDVRLEPSAYVGSGESPFYLREGKITTFYPHIMPRPDGGPKPITSGLVEPDDLEQHILWRLTMPKNLPLTFRIEYDEASSALAKQVADTAKAVAKRVGLTDLVGVTGALVEPVPESAFLGKWQTLGNGVIQSLDIQSAGVCQVTMGEGSEAIKPGTSVKGTWAWTVKEVLLDINDHIRGSSTMPSYVYRATVNGEGNLVIQRGEIWPQGSFMHPRPPEMVFKKVQ
jgi:hypothetical protein